MTEDALPTEGLPGAANNGPSDVAQASFSKDHMGGVLRSIIDQIPDMIYLKDREGRFIFANQAIVSTNGLTNLEELVGRTDFHFLPTDIAQLVTDAEHRVMQSGNPNLGSEELAFLGKPERWMMLSRVPYRDEAGNVSGVIGVSRDITAQKTAARFKAAQSSLLELIARGTPLVEFLEAFSRTIEGLAQGVKAVFLIPAGKQDPRPRVICPTLSLSDRSSGLRIADTVDLDDLAAVDTAVIELLGDSGLGIEDLRCESFPIHSDGRLGLILAICSSAATLARPDIVEFTKVATNLAGIAIARHQAEARITYLADHDPLTGMANRALLARKLASAVAASGETGENVTVAFLDIDNFKLVNDSLGHSVGDKLLENVARRVCDQIGSCGSLARIGGDEFVIVFTHTTEEDDMARLSAVRRAVGSSMTLGSSELRVTCSIGVARYPMHGKTAEELLAAADMAMYKVKQSGRDGIAMFDPGMAADFRKTLSRTEELRQAVARDELVLHFQPQIDARSGRMVGAEALVRWNHPSEGLLYPGDFISLAEETGQIVPIGEWVLLNACRQARSWQEMGFGPIRIGVNVSAKQFQEERLLDVVAGVLRESDLGPECLELEITESLIMEDVRGSVSRMRELKELGVQLAIDDFGTGYSSLSALTKFPLARIKIDRSFVADTDRAEGRSITSAIITLAQKLGIEVIAEGAETAEQVQFLLENGCNDIQGYFYSRPLSAVQFAQFLEQHASIKNLNAA